MDSRRSRPERAKPVVILASAVLWALLPAFSAHAQETTRPQAWRAPGSLHVSEKLPDVIRLRFPTPTGVQEQYASPGGSWTPLNTAAFGVSLERPRVGASRQQPPQARRERSTRSKVLGAVVGGVGGFFGGMFLGAAIEGDRCNCDDPGLLGALIGAPVGGVAGGILGYKFLF